MEALPLSITEPNAPAIIAVLEDFPIAELHEVLQRDGLYLPDICHW